MRMTGHLLVFLPIVVAMAVLGDLCFELRVPFGLGSHKGDRIVRWGMRGMGQQRAERHRASDDEA